MIQQKYERVVDRWNFDQMVVIEDEGDLMWDGGEFVYHRHQNGFYGGWLGRTEERQEVLLEARGAHCKCCDHIAPEARGIIVACI